MFKLITLRSLRMVAVTLLVCLLGTFAVAQSTVDGAIGGKVADSSGAILPNATVTVTNLGTNAVKTATSDSGGSFRIPFLQPGRYSVQVASSGFAPYKVGNVVVEVGRVTEINATLGVAASAETVEVSGEAPVINTVQQDFTTNINETSINELPINGRRWSNFALLTPGATPDGDFGLISFRGVSGLLNNNTVDGGDNNQAFFSEERGRTRISYVNSQASIKEFQVNTSNYSAEYGRSAGGVVNAVTKSGTNDFHGSAFWYYRDNAVGGATNPFTRQSFLESGVIVTRPIKPKDIRHQFGGTVGGPIIKDSVFFFFSYDQQKRDFPGVAAPALPTFFNPLSATEYTSLSGRGVSAAQGDAAMAYLLGLTGVVNRRGDQTIFFPKIDWKINDQHNFSISYNRMRWDSPAGVQTQAVVQRGIASFGNDGVKVDSVIARMFSALTNTIANEFRFQYGRDFEFQSSQAPAPGEPTTGPGGFPPSVAIGGGGFTFGKPNFLDRASYPDERRIQYADTVSWIAGNHSIKFGMDVNHVNDVLDNLFQGGGVYSYSNRVDWISDFVNPGANKRYTTFAQAFGPSRFEFNTTDFALFMQDDWKVHPRLTFNLGVRWEYQRLPKPQIPNALLAATSVFPDDKNNFGPRLGLAWDPTGTGRVAIRGGYGLYYGRIINSTISNAITNTGVTTGQRSFSVTPTTAGSPAYPNVLASAPTGGTFRPDVVVFGTDFESPMIHQGDIVFEYEVSRNTMVSASYLTSRGFNLPTFVDRNLAAPSGTQVYRVVGGEFDGQSFSTPKYTAARPDANFGRITNIESLVTSRYNAMVLQFNRRMTGGIQFQNNYTFAKAIDDNQISQTFTTGNALFSTYDFAAEKARSNFDIRHRVVSSVIWQPNYFKNSDNVFAKALFSDFTIAPVVQIASGKPFTGSVSGNAPGCPSGLFGINCSGGTGRTFFRQRNEFQYPWTYLVDLRLSRRVPITEKMKMEFLVEAFNLFNHRNVTNLESREFFISTQAAPSGTATTCGGTYNPAIPAGTAMLCNDATIGTPTAAGNTIFKERQMQWAIRFEF